MKQNKNKFQIGAIALFAVLTLWWLSFRGRVDHQTTSDQIQANFYSVMALYGSIIGFIAAKKWGGIKTVLGKAITFFSIGLLLQEIGQLTGDYLFYVKHSTVTPYPGIGDIAFFGSVIMYIVGVIYLSRAAGVHRFLKNSSAKVIAVIVPLVLLSFSGFLLVFNQQYDFSHPLTVFLDIGYPVGQAIYISLALVAYLVSRKAFGGLLRKCIIWVVVALIFQYAADFTFIYQSHKGTYVTGSYDDYFYLLAQFFMSTALIQFLSVYNKLGQKTNG